MKFKDYKNIQLSRLGMGNMRVPRVNNEPKGEIDYPAAKAMIDSAMANGINYYDTAYVYHEHTSEAFLGKALKDYPRDSYYVATKFYIRSNPDFKAVFEEQLNNLQTDYIDFYLIHCLVDDSYDEYVNSGCIEYFLEMQKEGKIKHLGFSSHASPEVLKKFAMHHDWDFVQIQLNYFDWKYGTAKEEYEILEALNIPVMVMEPIRGGRLSTLSEDATAILNAAHPEWTPSSWALRWVMSLPQVCVVLSGMTFPQHMEDNLKTANDFEPLTETEEATLMEALEAYHRYLSVPCTGCRYCCDDCPMQINIPEVLGIYNKFKVNGKGELKALKDIDTVNGPEACIGCGMCTHHCPQSIDIPTIMAEIAGLL